MGVVTSVHVGQIVSAYWELGRRHQCQVARLLGGWGEMTPSTPSARPVPVSTCPGRCLQTRTPQPWMKFTLHPPQARPPEQLVTGKEDGTNNCAHRHHMVGEEVVLGTRVPLRSYRVTTVLEKYLNQTLSQGSVPSRWPGLGGAGRD